jgi:hypothetical protein
MGYERGKIYKLWSVEGDDIYIGSTINTLTRRLNQHKCQHKKGHYISACLIFEKYKAVKIELMENFSCNNKNELTAREGYYIRNNTCVNKQIPNRTQEERYLDNREHILKRVKEYRDLNKDELSIKNKIYREKNKDKKKLYDAEYREKNKDKIKLYDHNRQRMKDTDETSH